MFVHLSFVFLLVCLASATQTSQSRRGDQEEETAQSAHERLADQGEPEDPTPAQLRALRRRRAIHPNQTGTDSCANLRRQIRSLLPAIRDQIAKKGGSARQLEDFLKSAEEYLGPLGGQGGATFTRWGRTSCPDTNTELVYNGVAAGGHYTHQGSGSDLLCVTRSPEYQNHTEAQEKHALIYGAEYESPQDYFSYRNAADNKKNALQDHDVPCAVCRAKTRSSQVMIPGRMTCHGEGWTREYWGFLATGHYAHKGQIQHVCVDEAPQGDPKGATNANGALLYVVQGVCGSLPCPPYKNGWELTCVVCTK